MKHKQDKEVEKSLARSKKTTLTFASELAKEGCSALVPGGGLMYEGIKSLVLHGIKFYEDKKEERITRFHEVLLGENAETRDEVLHKEFDIKDYTILLSHAVQDEEDDKIDIYSRIFKALQNERISKESKSHVLKSSRDLLVSDFELMKEIFISATYEFKDEGYIENQIKKITLVKDPIKNLSIQTLIRLGFLYDKDGTKPPHPTDLLKNLVSAIYAPDELTPEAIGRETWRDIQVYILCCNLDKNSTLLSKLSTLLSSNNIKTVIVDPTPHSFAQSDKIKFAYSQAKSSLILICHDGDLLTGKKILEYKRRFDKYNNKSVNIYFTENAYNMDQPVYKSTDTTKDRPKFCFKTNDSTEIQQFVDFVIKMLGNTGGNEGSALEYGK